MRRRTSPDPSVDDIDSWELEPEEDRGTLLEVVITIVAALALAFLVQQFLVKPFKIPSGSMENTLHCGDRVLVDRVSYRFSDIHRGDVVVFNPPAGIGEGGLPDPAIVADPSNMPKRGKDNTRDAVKADVNYIKRIVGLPGDKVRVEDHHAIIDGDPIKEPYLHPLPETNGAPVGLSDWPSGGGTMTVPKGTFLMLGDHRDNSSDGRSFGFVPESHIVGKAFMVYWPPKRFGGLPEKDPGGASASQADPNCLESAVPPGQTLDEDG
ncbi:MAG: signal peptidase [Thermoleophilia bacterium]|nr:signal peptidase [Thermoleophilia bacterium]MCZ4496838.1 signal peptidase [Thermoleophilia bacterium]